MTHHSKLENQQQFPSRLCFSALGKNEENVTAKFI